MTLVNPGRLWLLAALPALAAGYWLLQRRRRPRAVRFTNVELLGAVAPARAAWRRHLPAAGMALALATLVVGLAGPVARVRVPKEAATVMLVVDTSASMNATDVSPTRLDAAVEAASAFVEDLPAQHRVGLVAFDARARVLRAPTTDHGAVVDAIEGLALGPGTAAGDGHRAVVGAEGDGRHRDAG
ncbi:MAG TPA: VWA domain-containing protein, partial [Acidimicrobiales bacterium]|nr:VWA domain-containing protein [Acidimicrobiales bacterium]